MPAPALRPSPAVALCALLAVSCTGEGEGRPDTDLGNLVVSPIESKTEVDQDKASTDADALLEAVHLPHAWVGEVLGAHRVQATTSVLVQEGKSTVEELDDTLALEFDGEGRFSATLDNSREYGRHAVYDGKSLFLRPRFGLYNGRAAQSETEPSEIRSEMFGGAGDYLELFARQLEVSDRGAKTRDGRAVREIALKMAPSPSKAEPHTLAHKKWRDSVEVKSLSGLVALDSETGVALFVQFEGALAFERDSRRFQMSLSAERSISDVGHTRAVAAPPEEQILWSKARHRELDEREQLLESIAPPARKAPTPSNPGGIQ